MIKKRKNDVLSLPTPLRPPQNRGPRNGFEPLFGPFSRPLKKHAIRGVRDLSCGPSLLGPLPGVVFLRTSIKISKKRLNLFCEPAPTSPPSKNGKKNDEKLEAFTFVSRSGGHQNFSVYGPF